MRPSPDDGGRLGAPVSDRHRPPPAGEHVLAARRGGATPLASPSGPGAVRRCGPPGRVPVRDRRSKPARHQLVWGSVLRQAFSCPAGCAGGHANGGFSRWGPLTGTARLRRANADLLYARMAQRRLPAPSGPGGLTWLRPSGPRAGQRPALQAGTPSARVGLRLRPAVSCWRGVQENRHMGSSPGGAGIAASSAARRATYKPSWRHPHQGRLNSLWKKSRGVQAAMHPA